MVKGLQGHEVGPHALDGALLLPDHGFDRCDQLRRGSLGAHRNEMVWLVHDRPDESERLEGIDRMFGLVCGEPERSYEGVLREPPTLECEAVRDRASRGRVSEPSGALLDQASPCSPSTGSAERNFFVSLARRAGRIALTSFPCSGRGFSWAVH